LNVLDGPPTLGLDTALLKNFNFREGTYLQFRWEVFNMPNFVNFVRPTSPLENPPPARSSLPALLAKFSLG
jgi:hypothetical protein